MYHRKKKSCHFCLLVLLMLLCIMLPESSGIIPAVAFAENGAQAEWLPDSYEIHLMLDSDLVLNKNHLLKQEILNTFQADDDYKTFSLAYYETLEQDFFEEGWINRIRLKYEENDENDFKLTYKKRYHIPESDLYSAVHLAEADGFDLSGEQWEPELDWGYTGMTLSFSLEASIPADTEETLADLDPAEGFAMMKDHMPSEEQNWKSGLWGINTFQATELAGPIFFNRYTGKYLGQKVRIEVWEVHDERDDSVYYLTEMSFKTDEYEEAAAARKQMMDSLSYRYEDGNNILTMTKKINK